MSGEGKFVVNVTQEMLMCKHKGATKCEFYGNPEWAGFCSSHYREVQAKQKNKDSYEKNKKAVSNYFGQFEEKKHRKDDRKYNTLIAALTPGRKSPPGSGGSPYSATMPRMPAGGAAAGATSASAIPSSHTRQSQTRPTRHRNLSRDSAAARDHFIRFMKQCPKNIAEYVSRKTQYAVDKIHQATPGLPADDLSEMIQDLYTLVDGKLEKHVAMTNSKYAKEEIVGEMERYICTRAYHSLFCRDTDEEVSDLSLCDRIRSLNWVTAGFLETSFDHSLPAVVDHIDSAISEIIDMNSKRCPHDKLQSIVRCSNFIFKALNASSDGRPASADEYLPSLIYIILMANPPLLQSNINFISRFALQSSLQTGESGYYFTNLCCAKKHIQDMNADSLNMPQSDFEGYTSGAMVPPRTIANCGCQKAIKTMERNLEWLKEIESRLLTVEKEMDDRQKAEEDAVAEINEMVDEHLRAYPPPMPMEEWIIMRDQQEKERLIKKSETEEPGSESSGKNENVHDDRPIPTAVVLTTEKSADANADEPVAKAAEKS